MIGSKSTAERKLAIFSHTNFVNISFIPGINFLGIFIVNFLQKSNSGHHDENNHPILHTHLFVLRGCDILCTIRKKAEEKSK